MAASTQILRIVSRFGLVIAVILVIFSLTSFAWAWSVYTSQTIETVTEQTDVQSIETSIQTSAVVTTTNTSLYEQGTRLEDMPVYFFAISPNLTITVQTSTTAENGASVSYRLDLIQQASRGNQPFYTTNRTLLQESGRTQNGQIGASTTLNMSTVQANAQQIQLEIGSIGTFQTILQLEVTYDTGQYDGTLTASSPVQLTSGAYYLQSDLSDSQDHSRTTSQEIVQPPDRTTYLGLTILGLLFIGSAIGIAYFQRKIDVESLETEFDHDQFEEWISDGEFPTGTDKRYITINTLEDLVDIAIDSNKRVIFDRSLNVYSVVDGDLVYYFSHDPINIDVWLDT